MIDMMKDHFWVEKVLRFHFQDQCQSHAVRILYIYMSDKLINACLVGCNTCPGLRYNDGCNECFCDENGNSICTKKFCRFPRQPFCRENCNTVDCAVPKCGPKQRRIKPRGSCCEICVDSLVHWYILFVCDNKRIWNKIQNWRNVISIWEIPHCGRAHNIALQSGLQNGCPGAKHAFLVHPALPSSSHIQSLHPSLNPFGHVSHPTILIYNIINQIIYSNNIYNI